MRSDKSNAHHAVGKVDPNDQPIFVPGNVKNDAAISQDASAGKWCLYLVGSGPICLQGLSIPSHSRLDGVRIARRTFPESSQRGQSDDAHDRIIVPQWDCCNHGYVTAAVLRFWRLTSRSPASAAGASRVQQQVMRLALRQARSSKQQWGLADHPV